eukprot:TRINITY_DN3001_c0_g1_i2.p1 TRINITY_DN3001_c0_g1~~TRINITY_DN3001_c0_g1_i2.p1  ORF type:complete len:728 (+),score=127.04 TRINITY_DN3001_c0_g1_i2:151-2334(+)
MSTCGMMGRGNHRNRASTSDYESASPDAGDGLHVVTGKDTLQGIAVRYGLSVSELRRMNKLSYFSSLLCPGKVLIVRDPSTMPVLERVKSMPQFPSMVSTSDSSDGANTQGDLFEKEIILKQGWLEVSLDIRETQATSFQFRRAWVVLSRGMMRFYDTRQDSSLKVHSHTNKQLSQCIAFMEVDLCGWQGYTVSTTTPETSRRFCIKLESVLAQLDPVALRRAKQRHYLTAFSIQDAKSWASSLQMETSSATRTHEVIFSSIEMKHVEDSWLQNLRSNPHDEAEIVVNHMRMLLRLDEHPVGHMLKQFVLTWFIPYSNLSDAQWEDAASTSDGLLPDIVSSPTAAIIPPITPTTTPGPPTSLATAKRLHALYEAEDETELSRATTDEEGENDNGTLEVKLKISAISLKEGRSRLTRTGPRDGHIGNEGRQENDTSSDAAEASKSGRCANNNTTGDKGDNNTKKEDGDKRDDDDELDSDSSFGYCEEKRNPILEAVVQEVMDFRDSVLDTLMTQYETLALQDEDRRGMYFKEAIEMELYPSIYDHLMEVYHRAYLKEDEERRKRVSELLNISPAHIGVPRRFWLVEDRSLSLSKFSSYGIRLDQDSPYDLAIQSFRSIVNYKTPEQKANCLVETARAICTCIRRHWEGRMEARKLVLGGDELLPLFMFVIIKSNVFDSRRLPASPSKARPAKTRDHYLYSEMKFVPLPLALRHSSTSPRHSFNHLLVH